MVAIPELHGFHTPSTEAEYAAILARLPDDVRIACLRDKPLIMVNDTMGQTAILRPAATGENAWDVEIYARLYN
jgi:hypothetical protein